MNRLRKSFCLVPLCAPIDSLFPSLPDSFNKLHLQMEELEQKHLHLLQVVESEKTAKWQYTQHCDELTEEIKKLRNEVYRPPYQPFGE